MTPAQAERRANTAAGTDLLRTVIKRERKIGRHMSRVTPEAINRATSRSDLMASPFLRRYFRRLP